MYGSEKETKAQRHGLREFSPKGTKFLCLLILFICLFLKAKYSYALDFSTSFYSKGQINFYALKPNSLINPENIYNLPAYDGNWLLKYNISSYLTDDFSIEFKPMINTTFSAKQRSQLNLDFTEGYLAYDKGDFTTQAGREIISWGTAYAWNPTNPYVPKRNFQNLTFEKIGVDALQMQYFPEQNLTLTGILNLQDDKVFPAIKLYNLNNGYDLNFSINQDVNRRYKFGLAFAKVFGDALELHGEFATQKGSDQYYPVLSDPIQQIYTFSQNKKYSDNLYYNLVIGGQYTFESNTNLVLEYYYNSAGFNANEYQLFKDGVNESNKNKKYLPPIPTNPWAAYLLNISGIYQFANFRQNYLFARLSQPDLIEKLDTNLMGFYNIDDQSFVIMPEVWYRLNDIFNIFLNASFFFGRQESEFGSFYDNKVTLGFEAFF